MFRPARTIPTALSLLVLTAVATAQNVLPPLPLPDCAMNQLSPSASVDCEGMLVSGVTYGSPPEVSRPAQGSIVVDTAPSTIDFRNDVDRGGEQSVVISLQLPQLPDVELPNGDTLRSAIHVEWPAGFGPANDRLNCKHTGPGLFQWRVSSCDFFSPGPGQGSALFWRDTPCASTDTTCTYRVIWGPYQTRVNHPMILRAYVPWYLVYSRQLAAGPFDPTCSSLGAAGCLAGGGSNWFTFAVSGPPPPLQIDATVQRLGARSFAFDGSGSGPDVVSWEWRDGGSLGTVVATTSSFQIAYGPDEGPPFGVGTMALAIVDRWDREAIAFVPYSLLAPSGMPGPLEIDPLELVGIDDGVITLRAVVRNVGTGALTNVFVLGSELLNEVAVSVEPDAVDLDPSEEAVFTITVPFGDRNRRTVEAQAFGAGAGGTILSSKRSRRVDLDDGPPTTTTTTLPPGAGITALTQPSAPGDQRLEVASNDGFTVGGYATVNPGGATEETGHVVGFGSLVLAAPLASPHAAGETVVAVPPPGGDTAGPVITVTSPTSDTVVCLDAPLAAAFTCSDAGVGVAACGAAVANGDPLDTTSAGLQQATLRAWDRNGNLTEGTITWTVQGAVGFAGVRCALDAVGEAMAGATTDELDAKLRTKLGKLLGRIRTAVQAAEAAPNAKKRSKQIKVASAQVKRLQAQVAKGAKAKKVSASLADALRGRLDGGRNALSGLLAGG